MSQLKPEDINRLDIVHMVNESQPCVVLLGPLEIPYFHDGVASDFSFKPLDIQGPKEWEDTFTGYLCFNLVNENYEIHNLANLRKFDECVTEGYIPFDHGTGRLRTALGLIALSQKWYGNDDSKNFLGRHLKNFPTEEKKVKKISSES